MPIRSPNLDDLRFSTVRDDLVRRIPVHAPEWTDHNESDPGITLIELFATLAEQVGYRLNLIPEKNHIELLKLLGIHLRPARAARTKLAFFLASADTASTITLPAGTKAKAKKGSPPPSFELDSNLDIVPAELQVLVTTKADKLWDLLNGSQLSSSTTAPKTPADKTEWLTVAWDGAKPPLKEMPLQPVQALPVSDQHYLWLGLKCNNTIDAGFLGVRTTLTVQFDDDEQPDLTFEANCCTDTPAEPLPPATDWIWYFDAVTQTMQQVSGRIDDSTQGFTTSGGVRFTVPVTMGPIPADMFRNLRDPSSLSPAQQCTALGTGLQTRVTPLNTLTSNAGDLITYMTGLQSAITSAVTDAQAAAGSPAPPVLHPLDPKYRNATKVQGWIRLGPFPSLSGGTRKLRMVTFNAAPATNAATVTRELLGQANGRPGQTFALANQNVLPGTLQIGVVETPGGFVTSWMPVDSLDAAGPFDRQFEIDYEAGLLTAGDGRRGMIPQLTLGAGSVIALRYRHGGGKAGEVGPGTVTALESPTGAVIGCTNFIAATGGADAETLDKAKTRARKEISVRDRAVTSTDFEWIALQTPGVRVAKAVAVPLKRPLPDSPAPALPTAVRCGTLPAGSMGLDDSTIAFGTVSVVVVPDEMISEPVPVPSFLKAVCAHLNQHRLITTELYIVPPQYVRLCQFRITVKAKPGYTRLMVQDLVAADLGKYLHVLTGGEDGKGYPFGHQLHAADLVARLFRVEGVERVESLSANFTRTKSNAVPRQGVLTLCGTGADEHTVLPLAAEETVSVDLETLLLTTVD